MVFDFDIKVFHIWCKENEIPHVDTLYRLKFDNEKLENYEHADDKILQRPCSPRSNRIKARTSIEQETKENKEKYMK